MLVYAVRIIISNQQGEAATSKIVAAMAVAVAVVVPGTVVRSVSSPL